MVLADICPCHACEVRQHLLVLVSTVVHDFASFVEGRAFVGFDNFQLLCQALFHGIAVRFGMAHDFPVDGCAILGPTRVLIAWCYVCTFMSD